MDELYRLYLRVNDRVYRFKVFENTVWVERQLPHGDNLPFDRKTNDTARLICDKAGVWEVTALFELINFYEAVHP